MTIEVKECKTHGDTPHSISTDKGRIRYRCRKCAVDAVSKRRRALKNMAVEYKGGKCETCEYDKYIGALEFHHRDPSEKDFGISHKGSTMSWDAMKVELDKCVMLCANCHRELHNELRTAGTIG